MRSLAQLAELAHSRGYTLGQLWIELELNGDGGREAWELEREEAALVLELPPDVNTMLRVLVRNPSVTAPVLQVTERQLELLRQVPGELVPQKPSRPRGPERVLSTKAGVDVVRGIVQAAEDDRAAAHAGLISALPEHAKAALRPPEPKLVRHRNKRKLRRNPDKREPRRMRTHPYPRADWLDYGVSRRDVLEWMKRGQFSSDPLEREVCCRLRGKRWFLLRALTFALWHLRVEVARPGYVGAVAGFSRGQLSKLLPTQWHDGEPYVPRTISRALAVLRDLFDGLLEFNQPSPEHAEKYELPGAWHYDPEHGGRLRQADNLYWWRAYVARAVAPSSVVGSATEDRRSVCASSKINQGVGRQASIGEGVAAGAATSSGGRGPPHCEGSSAPHLADGRSSTPPEGF